MNQAFNVPIILSDEYDPTATFWTTVLPPTAVILGYYFVLRPLRRKQRLQYVPSFPSQPQRPC